jgi:hypothetical protein
MKTAIYIEDGVVQLVITPESEFEKNAVSQFANESMETKIFSGTFYDCRGGWVRQSEHYNRSGMYGGFISEDHSDKSLIIRTQKTPVSEAKADVSDERIAEIFDSLGGMNAFLGTFGFQQFARAILDEKKGQQ